MKKYTVYATKGNQTFEQTFAQYWQAATTAIRLQNIGFTVEVKEV